MAERPGRQVPFESDNDEERELWMALGGLPKDEPSPSLRRNFYRGLDHASRETALVRVRSFLGFGSNAGWVSATAAAVLGFGLAGGFGSPAPGGKSDSEARLAMLEDNVAMLNRELILDRLEHSNAGTRLRGVFDARAAADDDTIVQALLLRAAADRVPSVRSAAIDVLGDNLPAPEVGEALMALLESTEEPTVQLALVNLILRNGTRAQLARLRELASADHLHPDLIRHVTNSLGSERI